MKFKQKQKKRRKKLPFNFIEYYFYLEPYQHLSLSPTSAQLGMRELDFGSDGGCYYFVKQRGAE